MLKPITKIIDLFTNYADKQVVPASEYNSNFKAVQMAIEHNGAVLNEQCRITDDLIVDKLPEGGVSTGYIADKAVTKNKLAEDVLEQLYSTDVLSDYFKDFTPVYLHKQDPSYRGSILNGIVKDFNKTFIKNTEVEVSVKYVPKSYCAYVEDPERPDYAISVSLEDYGLTNPKPAEAFTFEIPAAYISQLNTEGITSSPRFWGGSCSWCTTVKLDAPRNIGKNEQDVFEFNWSYSTGNSKSDKTAFELDKIVFKNASGDVIATFTDFFSANALFKITQSDKSVSWTTNNKYRDCVMDSVNNNLQNAYANVCYIEIYHSLSYKSVGQGFNADLIKPVGAPTVATTPNILLNSLNTGGTAETLEGLYCNEQLNLLGETSVLTITAWLTTASTATLTPYNINLDVSVLYYALSPDNQISGDWDPPNIIITERVKGTATVVQTGSTEHFVKWTFQPPVIITGLVHGDHCSIMKVGSGSNSTFVYPDEAEAIAKEHGFTDAQYTPFSLGIDVANVQFSTTESNKYTINSISAARYDIDI